MAHTPKFVNVRIDINTPEISAVLQRIAHEAYCAGHSRATVEHAGNIDLQAAEAGFSDWMVYGPGAITLTGKS
jgi:hypothetical protein